MIAEKIEGFWIQGDPKLSISAQNPYIVYTETYQELVKKYGKALGEKYLWALFMLLDPSCKILFEQPRKKREENIKAYYINDDSFEWESLKKYIKMYSTEFLTLAKRNLSAIAATMDKLNNRMETFDEESNAEVKLIGGMIKNLKEVRAAYKLDSEEFQLQKKETEELLMTRGNTSMGPEEAEHFTNAG